MKLNQTPLPVTEFIALMALLTSLLALSIDAVLPALQIIGEDLNASDVKDSQLIIVSVFLGMAFGQIFYGPIADNIGRKPTIILGMVIFLIGSALSIFAQSMETMLIGRFLQGVGVASPRIVCMAIIRDGYQGSQMARISSFVMSIFILVPIIAPTLGYWVLQLSHWRMIFISIAVLSLMVLAWFYIRQPETLKKEYQQPFHLSKIIRNTMTVAKNKQVMAYTIINGLLFGAFLAYLSASQHIFQNIYQTGGHFPYYFALLAAAFGVAALANAKWVIKFGMRAITFYSLLLMVALNAVLYGYLAYFELSLNLTEAMFYLTALFFLIGLIFGNLTALSMEPLSTLAGIGAGVIGSISTFISVPLGNLIGTSIEHNLHHFILSFLACSSLSLIIMAYVEHKPASSNKK